MNDTLATTEPKQLTASDIRAQVQLIQQVMAAVMKEGTHFGTIPGTQKPTLYKAGSEKILSTFRIAIQPDVLDLSTADEARYRVTANALSQQSGAFLGSGVGEASSNEEKYKWREAKCEQEFDETPVDRRRYKWNGKGDNAYRVPQIRTNPADVANTVLKMAKKRAQIDATLTVTAASDVFAQDLEDLHDAGVEVADHDAPAKPQPPKPKPTSDVSATTSAPSTSGELRLISEPQQRRLYAKAMGAGWSKDQYQSFLKRAFNANSDREIPQRIYDDVCARIEQGPRAAGV